MPDVVGEAFVAIRASDSGAFKRDVEGIAAGAGGGAAGQKIGQDVGEGVKKGAAPGISSTAKSIAGLAVLAGASAFLKGANDEAREAQKVGAQTDAVLRSTAGAANIQASAVGALATELSKKVGIDDEVIQSGENMLLTFKNIRNEAGKGNDIFNQTTKATLDMAAGMAAASGGEIDMKSSAIQLGKALNDPVKGITALTRVGVTFTEQQKNQIKSMVENGNLLGAQKIILHEVMSEFGGSAAAQATDADKAHVAILNLKEAIGTALLPVIDKGAQLMTGLADSFTSLPGPAQQAITYLTLAGGAAVVLAKGVALIAETKGGLSAALTSIKTALTGGEEGGGLLGGKAAMASAGMWASAAFLIGGTAVGLSRTISGENYKIGLSMKELASTTDAQLSKALGTIAKFDLGLVKQSFGKVLEQDPASAQRFISALDQAGVKTGWFKDQLEKSIEAEGRHKTASEKHAAAVDQASAATDRNTTANQKNLDALEKLASQLDGMENKDLAAAQAHNRLADALDAQTGAAFAAAAASGTNADANKALERSTLDAEAAILADAQATRDSVTAHYGAAAGNEAYRKELQKTADSLAPDSPLRQYIQQLISDLDTVGGKHATPRVDVLGIDAALTAIAILKAQIDALNAGGSTVVPDFAGIEANANPYSGVQSVLNYLGSLPPDVPTIPQYASGGWVPGTGNLDSVPAMLTPGEYVMSKDEVAAARNGGGYTFNITTSAGINDAARMMREMTREARTEMHLAGL